MSPRQMIGMNRLLGLADSIRLSNFPSVWCNVVTGVAISWHFLPHLGYSIAGILLGLLVASCLYAGGNLLNDWWDRDWDLIHRPERALPSRVFAPSIYVGLALVLAFFSLLVAWAWSWLLVLVYFAIVVCILAYTWLHKHSVWSVIPMGGCRSALPWLGYATAGPEVGVPSGAAVWCLIAFSFALFLHTILISLSGRWFATGVPIRRSLIFSCLLGGGAALGVFGSSMLPAASGMWICGLSCLPYLSSFMRSLAGECRLHSHVRISWLLASFSWLDAGLLIPLALSPGGKACVFSVWVAPFCVALARLLQRCSSAT